MIKIGILGLGTVGSGVVKIMKNSSGNIKKKVGTELKIDKVLVKDKNKKRNIKLNKKLLTDQAEEIINNPEIDLIVELIGGENPAYEYIIKGIKSGKSIVTANKLVIAKHGKEIHELAQKYEVQVCYEGSVAGGLPIIRPLRESLAANRISEIYGILNGTTNYILTEMTKNGKDFSEALTEAQKLGYAERDPSSDISGQDAAYKISILSSIAFETFVDINSIYAEGINKISLPDIELAEELGYVIKLLAIGKKREDGLDVRVHPTFVPQNHPLALVNSVYNAVYLHGDAVGDVMSYGKGAGQMPTGSAVVADIIQAAKDIYYKNPDTYSMNNYIDNKIVNIEEVENRFYIRIQVNDKPGVMAKVTKVLGDRKVSLASVLQKHRLSKVVPLVLITHPVKEKYLNDSLKELKQLDDVLEINSVIRVEKETN
ncbi:MAG: homoserine dehydrogenase [Bacillota bacterium]